MKKVVKNTKLIDFTGDQITVRMTQKGLEDFVFVKILPRYPKKQRIAIMSNDQNNNQNKKSNNI